MKKVGLCLSGGGARGAYQVGVMHALKDLGIFDNINTYSGTSIGSANVTVLACHSLEAVDKIWSSIPEEPITRNVHNLRELVKAGFSILDHGIYSMDKFKKVVKESIDREITGKEVFVTISDSGEERFRDIFKSSYDHYIKRDKKAIYIPVHKLNKDDTYTSVIASCSIPIFFGPVNIDDRRYYDGGVFDNHPVQPLIDAGCDEIFLVNITGIFNSFYYKRHYPNVKIHEIKHLGLLGSILNFSNKQSEKLINYGYKNMMKYYNKNILKEEDVSKVADEEN